MKRNIVNKTLTSTDDAPKVANNVEKLPKRYWFTLILMWIVCSFVFYTILRPDSISYYISTFSYLLVFILLLFLMIYLVTHYLEKINLIRIYSAAFYLTLFLFIYFIYIHLSIKALPIGIEGKKAYCYMMTINYMVSGYCFFVFCFLTFHASYLVFRKKFKNITTPVVPFASFIIFWGLMFIISFPLMTIYLVKYVELFAEN